VEDFFVASIIGTIGGEIIYCLRSIEKTLGTSEKQLFFTETITLFQNWTFKK